MMSIVKSKLLMMIELLQEEDAQSLLNYMTSHYSLTKNATWDQVEEVTPDEWDLAMIKEIEENPEEHRPYLSQEQLMAELGL